MGLRFYRRVRIAPGFTLNLGKRGVSLSVGRRGAHGTLGRRGVRGTVGLPGTGLYYTTALAHGPRPAPIAGERGKRGSLVALVALVVLYVLIRAALYALALQL